MTKSHHETNGMEVHDSELTASAVLSGEAAAAYEPGLLAKAVKIQHSLPSPEEALRHLGRILYGKDYAAIEKFVTGAQEQQQFFKGYKKSWVYRCVGAAEGNLEPDGTKKGSYEGHRDLNGNWNKGAFSNQRDNVATAEEADRLQFERLKRHNKTITRLASKYGLTLSTEERMNGLDLANQAEQAVFEGWGYIERLSLAKRREGLKGDEAILYARKWSFFNPSVRGGKGEWQSGVFGNDPNVIEADQRRRMDAINQTLKLLRVKK